MKRLTMRHVAGDWRAVRDRLWWQLVVGVQFVRDQRLDQGSGKLVIDNESGSTWTCQFNPFNPALLGPGITFGFVYEPLEFVDILAEVNKPPVPPWLATSSQWSNGFKTLTFTIRSGVNWSDGKPFSAADVAYTFNAMKSDKAIDLNALWTAAGGPLTSVSAKGTNQVVFTFKPPSQPYFYLRR